MGIPYGNSCVEPSTVLEKRAPSMSSFSSSASSKEALANESSPNSKAEKTSLNQALVDKLDSVLQEVNNSKVMSKADTKKPDDDNNNATQVLDDLTKQLMEALDTNEVVPWNSSEDTKTSLKDDGPFG